MQYPIASIDIDMDKHLGHSDWLQVGSMGEGMFFRLIWQTNDVLKIADQAPGLFRHRCMESVCVVNRRMSSGQPGP